MPRLGSVASRSLLAMGLGATACPADDTGQATGRSSTSGAASTTSDAASTSGATTGASTTSADSSGTSTAVESTTDATTTDAGSDTDPSSSDSTGTTTAATTTGIADACGNGVIDDDEDCDGEALAQTCEGLGFLGGTLACTDVCGFDIGECLVFACGNGQCDSAEDSCNCVMDCPDDPSACSACECGDADANPSCSCAEDCFASDTCCDDICDAEASCGTALFGCAVCGDDVCGAGEDSCNCLADCPDDPDSCSACDCGMPAGGGHCGCDEGCFAAGDCCVDVCDALACQVELDGCPDTGEVVFEFTGDVQDFVVPAFVTDVHVQVWGGEGGSTPAALLNCGMTPAVGGLGGFAEGDLAVMPGENLFVYVGGAGGNDGNSPGWNGGGSSCPAMSTCSSGGGASDVRRGGQDLDDRVIVAGGGGGGEYNCDGGGGGGGGGLVGDPGTNGDAVAADGQGGTQLAGGTAGVGASDGVLGTGGNGSPDGIGHSGGGGGGWYGGGGGGVDGSGGGGSSYIDGVENGATIADQRVGNGVVVVSWGG